MAGCIRSGSMQAARHTPGPRGPGSGGIGREGGSPAEHGALHRRLAGPGTRSGPRSLRLSPRSAYTRQVSLSTPRHIASVAAALLGAALGALGAGLGACGTAEPVPEAGPTARGSFALLQVERTRFDGALPGERFEHFEIGARVARFSGLEREAAATLLGTEELSEPEALDECSAATPVLPGEELVGDQLEHSEIELVDVGVIDVRAGDRSLTLEPQSFPGLLSLLQGAIYGTSDAGGAAWDPGTEWTFSARGTTGVGAFEIMAEAPGELVVQRIGADDPALVPPTIERGADLPVRWEAGSRDDVVRIELGWSQLGTEMRIACAAVDDGAFVVPAWLLRQLPDPALVASPRVAVRRERRRAFGASGLDEGILLVSQTDTFGARVR